MADAEFTAVRTPRLILRRLVPADAAALAYRDLPHVARYQSWDTFGPDDARSLVAQMAGLHPDVPGTWFQFGIQIVSSGVLAGDCGLHCRADDPRQVEVGITLDPACQGAGIATEALTGLLDYVFARLHKHRVTATTDAANDRAARLLTRVGFRREGHFRQNVWFKGQWGDEFLFALLRTEWEQLRDPTPGTPAPTRPGGCG
jgi:RimJ/RimL family protein N-acetyltransferase